MMDIHILILDLEETLVRKGRFFPHAPEALDAFGRFTTNAGDPLPMGLIVDAQMPEAASEKQDVDAVLDQLGLREFFDDHAERTIRVVPEETGQLPRELFKTALRQMKNPGELENAALLTGKTTMIQTCKDYGMHVLHFASSDVPEADFNDWADAPLQVARSLFPENGTNLEVGLSVCLRIRYGMEVVSLEGAREKKTIRGVAKSWFPLEDERLGPLSGVHVQMPARFQVDLDDEGHVHALSTTPGTDEMQEVSHHILSLYAHGSIQEEIGELRPGCTHIVEKDTMGRRCLVRTRFS